MKENIQEIQVPFKSDCKKYLMSLPIIMYKTHYVSTKRTNKKLNFLSEMKETRKSYEKNLIVGQLNMHSLRNKVLSVTESVKRL